MGTHHVLRVIAGLVAAPLASAAMLHGHVKDRDGAPVADVVVVAKPTVSRGSAAAAAASAAADPNQPAVMDQMSLQFNPEVLVVPRGRSVVFPNSDSVAHHVYSFSPTQRFSLGLYRGQPYPPQVFDRAGVVVLGCNIHDSMVGYIFVADSPYYAKSDAAGMAMIDLPAGTYELSAWTSRSGEDEPETLQQVTVHDGEMVNVDLHLTRKLQPPRNDTRKPGRLRY